MNYLLPLVIFFGGHGADGDAMSEWTAAARAKCGGKYEFVAAPYPPGATPDRASVDSHDGDLVRRFINLIDKNPQRPVVIVGHSSASAIADAVAAKISKPSRAKLVVLDGFHPDEALQERIQTACWSSQEGRLTSPNFFKERAACGSNFHIETVGGCRSSMCMHFKLVNLNADPDLTGGKSSRDPDHGYVIKGYSHLNVNLDWLTNSCSATVASSGTPNGLISPSGSAR